MIKKVVNSKWSVGRWSLVLIKPLYIVFCFFIITEYHCIYFLLVKECQKINKCLKQMLEKIYLKAVSHTPCFLVSLGLTLNFTTRKKIERIKPFVEAD